MPRVSVGLPLYNAEAFLEETLEALLAQSYDDFELIIADNASTDRTGAICRAYAGRDERVRYVRSDRNRGAAPNFNRVFELATGEYFKWAAYDDRCAPTFLERCVAVLDSRPEVVLAYPGTVRLAADGTVLGNCADRLHLVAPRAHLRLLKYVTSYTLLNALFGVIRSGVLRQTRLVGSYRASDTVLLAELCLRGCLWEVPEYLFYRRDHAANYRRRPRDEQARWFDTAAQTPDRSVRVKLLVELLAAVRQAPLGCDEKVLCSLHLGLWVLRQFVTIGGDVRRKLAGSGGAGAP